MNSLNDNTAMLRDLQKGVQNMNTMMEGLFDQVSKMNKKLNIMQNVIDQVRSPFPVSPVTGIAALASPATRLAQAENAHEEDADAEEDEEDEEAEAEEDEEADADAEAEVPKSPTKSKSRKLRKKV